MTDNGKGGGVQMKGRRGENKVSGRSECPDVGTRGPGKWWPRNKRERKTATS